MPRKTGLLAALSTIALAAGLSTSAEAQQLSDRCEEILNIQTVEELQNALANLQPDDPCVELVLARIETLSAPAAGPGGPGGPY